MAEELLEYRPGRWAKVVNGRIVGRATPEEVAAWKAERGLDPPPADDVDLDIDVGDSSIRPAAGPGRAEAPLRPAFERRGLSVQPAQARPQAPDGPPSRPAPQVTPHRLEMEVPPQPTLRPAAEVPGEQPPARHGARTRPPLNPPDEGNTGGPVLVRRKITRPPEPPSPAPTPRGVPARPARELPKPPERTAVESARPQTTETSPPQERSAPRPVVEEPAEPLAAAAAGPVESGEDEVVSAAPRDPSYWWIWNAYQQPVEAFLREWLPRYQEKFGHPATIIICHEDDLAAAQAAGYDAQPSTVLQPGHFYLGHTVEAKPARKKRGS